jgi:hypothetical protein
LSGFTAAEYTDAGAYRVVTEHLVSIPLGRTEKPISTIIPGEVTVILLLGSLKNGETGGEVFVDWVFHGLLAVSPNASERRKL